MRPIRYRTLSPSARHHSVTGTPALLRRARRRAPEARSPLGTFIAVLAALVTGILVVVIGGAGLAGVATVASITSLSRDLPDPSALATLEFDQPTIVYDRTGRTELARFQRTKRDVVDYREIPEVVLDATIVAEDRSFWENDGFDLQAMLAAAIETAQGDGRGASTITQQLVRARLLPEDIVSPGADLYLRKAKEVIQSARLTQAFPGQTGKQQIITAYLNEIYYGHDAYGIAAAAQVYFGVDDLADLTPAQAAILAGLPQSPSALDPYRYAVQDAEGRLVVPPDAPPVVRRNWILENLEAGRWTRLDAVDRAAALAEPVILRGDRPMIWRAPHFTWQVRRQLQAILGGPDAVDTGGYRVITTLDWRAQRLAEDSVTAAVVAPNIARTRAAGLLRRLDIPRGDRRWIAGLRGKDLHNAALVAIDYRTGDVRAYVGSGGYYRDALGNRRFNPKFDAAGTGSRQPGSAFKPILYAAAFERRVLTPGSLLLDITTTFAPRARWTPRDADRLDRGPVLVRDALQMSLNVPAIRALQRAGNEAVAEVSERMGLRFAGGRKAFLQAGLAGAIGTVEVRPLDLTSAFGTLGNGGVHVPPRMILEIRDATGRVVWKAQPPARERALSAATAFLVSDILAGNTDPKQNKIWAEKLALTNGPDGKRRLAAVKTGTANDARDLSTYGYLAPPRDPDAPGWAVGVWIGNSDHSTPRTRQPATSLTAAAPLWQSFVRRLTSGDPVDTFERPKGVVEASIDAWTGGRPGPWTRARTLELFRAGTQPGGKREVDPAGLLYRRACGTWVVDPIKAELGPAAWDADVANWLARARRGTGVIGPLDSRTAYFWGRSSWGGRLAGPCPAPPPAPVPEATSGPSDGPPGGRKPVKPSPPPQPSPPAEGGEAPTP